MAKIASIRSGGQSGVDRAALDAARAAGIRIEGWVPEGGWAEDYPTPPGVLVLYPELRPTYALTVEKFGQKRPIRPILHEFLDSERNR